MTKRFAIINNSQVENIALADAPITEFWIDLANVTPSPAIGWTYANGVFTAPPAPEPIPKPANPPILSPYRFKRRMTAQERVAIRTAASTNAAIYDYMDMLDTAPSVNLTDSLTRDGINTLAAAGLLTTARATEILDTPVSDEEV